MSENSKAFPEKSISEIPHIDSVDREQHNKHDFKIYKADIESSGTRINPIDLSACGKGRAGNGDQCLYHVSFRVKVSLFSLRLSFYTDWVETCWKKYFVQSSPGLLNVHKSMSVKMTDGPTQVSKRLLLLTSKVMTLEMSSQFSSTNDFLSPCCEHIYTAAQVSLGIRIIIQPALPVSQLSITLQKGYCLLKLWFCFVDQ